MKIFITGATGFIGTHLLQRLANSDHEVACLVRLGGETRAMESAGSRVVHGDVTDRNSLTAPIARCDWVVNLANVYSFWEPAPSVYSAVNIEGTRNVMEAALVAGVSKIAHVSSAVTYGKPAQIPFDEQSCAGPVLFSEYARTKFAGDGIAEIIVRALEKEGHLGEKYLACAEVRTIESRA